MPLSGRSAHAFGGDVSAGGNRAAAGEVAGAKKYVRSRTRFHENAAARDLAYGIVADD